MKGSLLQLKLMFGCLLIIILISSETHGDTIINSNIITDTTWTKAGSPYIITIDLDVYPNATLTIEPGVVVSFNSGTDLEVYGGLIAIGTATEFIGFQSSEVVTPIRGDWNGIIFKEGAVGTTSDLSGGYLSGSIIKFCKIAYGGGVSNPNYDIDLFFISNNMFHNSSGFITYGNSTIENNNITNCNGSAIYNKGTSKINNNRLNYNVASNYGGGIYNSGDSSEILNNNIQLNSAVGYGGGIYNSGDFTTISGNVVNQNTLSTATGCWNEFDCALGGGISNISNSTIIEKNYVDYNSLNCIRDNFCGGEGIYSLNNVTMQENSITFNSVSGVPTGLGAIFVEDVSSNTKDSAILRNNKISYNTAAGIYILDSSWEPTEIVIEDNEIIGNNQEGIELNHDITGKIIRNQIENNGGSGILKRYYSGGEITVANCTIKANGSAGIYGSFTEVRNNVIDSNSGYGIAVNVSSYILNNFILNNGDFGIGIGRFFSSDRFSNSIIQNNDVQYNEGDGITYWGGYAENSTITHNLVQYNTEAGIRCDNSSVNNNHITNNSYGIYTSGLSSVMENDIYNNTTYDFNYTGTTDQIANNNYWGTTNTSEISSNIYDYWDEISLGKVIFEPFASEPFSIPNSSIFFESVVTGDLNNDGSDDLAGVSISEQVRYSTDLTTWTDITGELETIVCGDLNGDGNDDIAGVNSIGQVWYTTDMSSWTNIPGIVAAIVTGDLDGDGDDDIAGINPNGMISKIFYTTDLSTWTPIPGLITSIVTGDLDGDGDDDIAGINPNGVISKIFYTTNLSTWTPIPGLITLIITGDLDGDGNDDIAGINPNGVISKIFYTTDLSNWTPIPGLITSIVAGDFDGDGDDDIAGINPNGVLAKIFYTNDLVNWNIIPGALDMITTGNFNADGRDDLAGINRSTGMTWHTTDLATWTNIP